MKSEGRGWNVRHRRQLTGRQPTASGPDERTENGEAMGIGKRGQRANSICIVYVLTLLVICDCAMTTPSTQKRERRRTCLV